MNGTNAQVSGGSASGGCSLCGASLPVGPEETVQGRDYHLCAVCDLMQMAGKDRLSTADEKKRYLQHNNSIRTQGYISFLERLMLPVIAELESQGREAEAIKGLDFGSGPYPMLAELMAERGFLLDLYDPIFAPRDKDKLLASAFDYIVCCETIEHFYHPHDEFDFMTKLLAPGGFIAIMTSLRRPDTGMAHWHYAQDETHVALYSEKTIHWLARHFGLRAGLNGSGVIFLHAMES
jgi:hypothetical protein